MGLLITPSGIRIPFCKPYYTHEYCKKTGRAHRTTAEAAADLIRELPLPEEAQVIVLGDTAYDSEAVQKLARTAATRRSFRATPSAVLGRPEREAAEGAFALEGLVAVVAADHQAGSGQGSYAVYRRLSPHRIGPKAKPRAYYAHQERRRVHSVGEVRLVFSTTQKDLPTATPDDVKILMTNDLRLSVPAVIELYSLRWQMSCFSRNSSGRWASTSTSSRNLGRWRAGRSCALTTFMYLEWYRVQQMSRRDLNDDEKAGGDISGRTVYAKRSD